LPWDLSPAVVPPDVFVVCDLSPPLLPSPVPPDVFVDCSEDWDLLAPVFAASVDAAAPPLWWFFPSPPPLPSPLPPPPPMSWLWWSLGASWRCAVAALSLLWSFECESAARAGEDRATINRSPARRIAAATMSLRNRRGASKRCSTSE